eukprot:SAG31_NODE_198_length_20656_cov_5.167291_21_plen_282_part_00
MLAAALLGQLLVLSAAVGTATSLPTARRLGNETSADSGSMNLRRDKTDACIPPGALALGAQQICSGAPVGAALLSVRVHGHEIAEWALAALGFREVMDLQLLAGTPEAEELMDELKLSAGLSIPDRAKLRLLIGAGAKDQAHLADHTAAANADGPLGRTPAGDSHGPNAGLPRTVLRTLQEERTDGGVSADTIAIVMSVLVGAAGYLVQVGVVSTPGDTLSLCVFARILILKFDHRPTRPGGRSKARRSWRRSSTFPSRRAGVSTSRCWRRLVGRIGAPTI